MTIPRAATTGTQAIPATMQAAAIERFGPPAVLGFHTLPVPRVGSSEVLIEMHAAGVGVWDARMRDGSWWPTPRPRFPLVLGTDGAGVVASRGSRVRRFDVGDRVWAYEYANPKGGFYAEYVTVDAGHVGHAPDHLNMREAGAAAVTGLTALQGIDDWLRVRQGEVVLIFGASGGVGTLAVQFAKRRQARVVGMVRGRDAVALVRQLGAEAAIDTRAEDAIDRLRDLVPEGLDAVLALAGGETLERCVELLGTGGRVAYPNGVEPEPRRRRGLRMHAYDAEATPREFAQLERAVDEARLRVPIAKVFTLAQAAAAHARLERGHLLGRIVLQIRD